MLVTMTWLERYLAILDELDDLETRIARIDGQGSQGFSPNPTRTFNIGGIDQLLVKREKLYKIYLKKLKRGREIVLEIEAFLEQVEDPMTRRIIRLKYIDGLTWRDVGDEVHMDPSSCYRKVKRDIKTCNKCNKDV